MLTYIGFFSPLVWNNTLYKKRLITQKLNILHKEHTLDLHKKVFFAYSV